MVKTVEEILKGQPSKSLQSAQITEDDIRAAEFVAHVSDKPWSDYKESDYSLQQWHDACLVHQHTGGTPTSKTECKLPVKTPNGVLNRNGVHAAAAALAGARSSINLTVPQKGEAARKIASLYTQLNEKPSPKLIEMKALHSDVSEDPVDAVLSHHGVKGMKWGVRKSGSSGGGGGGKPAGETKKMSSDARNVEILRAKNAKELSNKQLKTINERINMEKKFRELNPNKIDKGHTKIKYLMTFAATGIAIHQAFNSPAGQAAIARGRKFLASPRVQGTAKKAAEAAVEGA